MYSILIVDDDAPLRLMLQQVLTRASYRASVASNGREGLELFEKSPADLVIMDLIMPEKEGIESIRELHQRFPQTKILAISGGMRGGSMDMLPMARMLGADRGLAKPFSHRELLSVVEELLHVTETWKGSPGEARQP